MVQGYKNSSGFTLIEVMLVVAISSLLTLILVSMTTQQTSRTRFNNDMEDVSGFINQAKEEANATTGVGDFEHQVGTDRIVFGKAVIFHEEGMASLLLTAANTDGELCDVQYHDNLWDLAMMLGVIGTPSLPYEYAWGSEWLRGDSDYGAIVFGRHPHDGALRTYFFDNWYGHSLDSVVFNDSCLTPPHPYADSSVMPEVSSFRFESPEGYEANIIVEKEGSARVEYHD